MRIYKTNDNREKGRVVGYNIRNGLVIVRVHKDFGWRRMEESEDVLVYTRFKQDNYCFIMYILIILL